MTIVLGTPRRGGGESLNAIGGTIMQEVEACGGSKVEEAEQSPLSARAGVFQAGGLPTLRPVTSATADHVSLQKL